MQISLVKVEYHEWFHVNILCVVVVSNLMIVSVPDNITLDDLNSPHQIVCTVRGNPAPNIQWFRDDEHIAEKGNQHIQTTTHGYERTSIFTVLPTATGKYTFKASNKHGEVKQNFILGKWIVSVFLSGLCN